VQLAKTWLQFGLQKNWGFCFGFGSAVSVFSVRLGLHLSVDVDAIFQIHLRLYGMMLEMTYFHAELAQLIVSGSDSELDVQRYGMKKDFDCCSYYAERWIVNETTWKTVPKLPKSVFENRTTETEFLVFEFWGPFGLAFRKPISDIFIGFCTALKFLI